MSQREDVLGIENNLCVRLYSVEYPDEQNAVVTFEILSDGHNVKEPTRPLACIRQGVILNGKGRNDFGQIVATAANKLKADFSKMAATLSTTYLDGQ